MAATLIEEQVIPIGQGMAIVLGTVAMDNSYATGGEALDAPGDRGYAKFALAGGGGGYVGQWDKAAQKVMAYRQTAATGALAEVPNTTDLAAVTFDFIAIRPA